MTVDVSATQISGSHCHCLDPYCWSRLTSSVFTRLFCKSGHFVECNSLSNNSITLTLTVTKVTSLKVAKLLRHHSCSVPALSTTWNMEYFCVCMLHMHTVVVNRGCDHRGKNCGSLEWNFF